MAPTLCPLTYLLPVADAVKAWAMLRSHRIWPVVGGLDEQAAPFVAAVRVLDGAQAAKEREEIERQSG